MFANYGEIYINIRREVIWLNARAVLPKLRFGNTRLAGCDVSVVPKPVLLSAAAAAAASRTVKLSAGVAVLVELNCGLAFGSS